MSNPDVRASLGPLMAELWLKWMSTAPCLMWKPLSAFRWYAVLRWGLCLCHCCQVLCGLGKVEACVRSAVLHGRETLGTNNPEPSTTDMKQRKLKVNTHEPNVNSNDTKIKHSQTHGKRTMHSTLTQKLVLCWNTIFSAQVDTQWRFANANLLGCSGKCRVHDVLAWNHYEFSMY